MSKGSSPSHRVILTIAKCEITTDEAKTFLKFILNQSISILFVLVSLFSYSIISLYIVVLLNEKH